MENKEIVELSKKDIIKKINKIRDRKTYENIDSDYQEKKAAMALLGFGSDTLVNNLFPNQEIKLPKIDDKRYIGKVISEFSDEMINSQFIDLVLLEELVKVQNGIEDSNIPLSNEVKEILIDDKLLESTKGLSRENNLKRLKVNIEDGRINSEQEWVELLKENTDYNKIKVNDNERAEFLKQVPSEKPIEALIIDKPTLKSEKTIPVVQKDVQEYWREKYIQKMNEYGLTEVHMDEYLKQTNRKYKDNMLASKVYNAYDWLLDKTVYPFKEVSIAKLDDEYNIPTYSLFKESRSGKGVKFNQLPEPGHDMAYELAALKVRESGIEKPFVYATKPTSNQDLIAKNRFIENQINALIEYGEYDINDIDVPHQFKPVLEKIKKEQEMKKAQVIDTNELLNKVILGDTNTSEREMFLDFINITKNINGEEVSMNFDMNNKNDVNLLQNISNGNEIKNDENELLKQKVEFAKNYIPESPSFEEKNNDVDPNLNNNIELNQGQSSEIDLESMTPTSKESDIIANPKILQKFQDYEGTQINPETNVNETLEAIISLKNKLSIPEISEKLDDEQKNMIERKGVIAETFRDFPELDEEQKSLIKKVLENGNVAENFRQLEAAQVGVLTEAIDKFNMEDLDKTISNMRGLGNPAPNIDVESIKTVNKAINENMSEEEAQYNNEVNPIDIVPNNEQFDPLEDFTGEVPQYLDNNDQLGQPKESEDPFKKNRNINKNKKLNIKPSPSKKR